MKLSNWTMKSSNWPRPHRRGRRRAVVSASLAVLAVTAVLGIGSMTAAGADSGDVLRHRPRRRRRRVAARRVLVHVGQHRAVGAGRADLRSSSTASSPRAPTTFAATVAANTVNGGFNGHADARRPAGEHRVLLPRRRRRRLVRDVRVQDPEVRRQLRLPVLRRPADRLVRRRGQGRRRLGGHPERRPRREPERRAAGVRRRPGRDRQHRDAVERVPRAPTSCASTRGPPRSATTTSAARPTSSTSGRRTPTAPRRSTRAARRPSPAATTGTSTRACCSST